MLCAFDKVSGSMGLRDFLSLLTSHSKASPESLEFLRSSTYISAGKSSSITAGTSSSGVVGSRGAGSTLTLAFLVFLLFGEGTEPTSVRESMVCRFFSGPFAGSGAAHNFHFFAVTLLSTVQIMQLTISHGAAFPFSSLVWMQASCLEQRQSSQWIHG